MRRPPGGGEPQSAHKAPISDVEESTDRGEHASGIASSRGEIELFPSEAATPCFEALLRAAANLPIDEGVQAIAQELCATLGEAIPDAAIGVVVVGEGIEGGPLIVTTAAPHSADPVTRMFPRASRRLFPTLRDEWVVALPAPFETASVHVAEFAFGANRSNADAFGPAGRGEEPNEQTRRLARGTGDPRGRLLAQAAESGALVLAAGLRGVENLRATRGESSSLRKLQARIAQNEKLANVGQIAAKVVHELNNPLTAIVTYADYLAKKLENAGHESSDVERLRRIGESADRILRFSRDLTAYARPHEDQAQLEMRDVIERAVAFCEHVTLERGILVTVRFDPATPTLVGLRGQLIQVFVNLITNACHAIDDAGREHGAIQIVAEPSGASGVQIAVGDNGKGIAPECVARVFDPFYTTKSEGRGTGLGLSIVRSIVERHGGWVSVRSVVGVGSSFVVVLRGLRPS